MKITLGLDGITTGVHDKQWDGGRYKVVMTSPAKMNTQGILNTICKNDSELVTTLLHDKDNEKVKVYINNQYISDVIKSKYKAISNVVDNKKYHIDNAVEINKSGNYKVTPSLFFEYLDN